MGREKAGETATCPVGFLVLGRQLGVHVRLREAKQAQLLRAGVGGTFPEGEGRFAAHLTLAPPNLPGGGGHTVGVSLILEGVFAQKKR